ncbi:MAG TPA: hypothetical protein VEB63_09650 [Chitinophagaceae bacterium]|nr:hypothetical protein [Chitinophagaceae bacterium]
MKSILIALLATAVSTGLWAQSVEDIRDLAGKNQWEKAKEQVDKYLSNEKNARRGEGWYLKAVIYSNISRDANLLAKYANAREESFSAYKKYLEVDKEAVEGTLSQHGVLFDVVSGYLVDASAAFNAKKFEQALIQFREAEKVQDFIVAKKFSYGNFEFPVYDTQLYLNIAAAAVNAKKDDIAMEYYEKIADKKIKGPSYEEIYRYLVDRYYKKGDKERTEKYLAIGKEVYPQDEFWCQVGLADLWDGDKRKLFARFEELINSNCSTYLNYYNYAVELFNFTFAAEKRPDDFATLEARIPALLKKALESRQTVEANMLMARYYFGHINDLYDQLGTIKGAKPEDVKKRGDLSGQINKRFDELMPYAMAAYEELNAKPTLKTSEKGTMKIVLSMIVEYWERKKNPAKAKEFQDKMKAVE